MEEKKEFGNGAKYLVKENMNAMLDIILEEVNDFTLQAGIKMKSIGVLYNIVKGCGSKVVNYVEKILFALYKNINNDEEEIMVKIEETANNLGLFIDQDILVPILYKHLTDLEIKNAPQPFCCRVKIFSNIVSKFVSIRPKTARTVLNIINELDIFNLPDSPYNKENLINFYKVYDSLITHLHTNKIASKDFHSDIFIPLLFLQSLPETESIHLKVRNETMPSLAIYCGFENLEDIYSLEMQIILEKFMSSHHEWRRNSSDRFAFDSLVKNAGIALKESWKEVLTIISNCIDIEKDLEMRVDMMVLMERIIDSKVLSEDAKIFSPFMIREILIPGTYWKNNRPSYKIRQVALACLIKVFDNKLVDLDQFGEVDIITEFFSVLKVTLADDWDAYLRFLSILLVGRIFQYCEKIITENHMSDSYNMILKRMDDAQDNVRKEACNVFKIFFQLCIKGKNISMTQYKFIIETLFVHLDDQKEEIRNEVKHVLIVASNIYTERFIEIGKENLLRFTHQSICSEVVEHAKSVLR